MYGAKVLFRPRCYMVARCYIVPRYYIVAAEKLCNWTPQCTSRTPILSVRNTGTPKTPVCLTTLENAANQAALNIPPSHPA